MMLTSIASCKKKELCIHIIQRNVDFFFQIAYSAVNIYLIAVSLFFINKIVKSNSNKVYNYILHLKKKDQNLIPKKSLK